MMERLPTDHPGESGGAALPAGWLWRCRFSCKFPLPIQAPILNRFADVGRAELSCPGEIGYGPGDLEDPVVGPGRETETGNRLPHDRFDRSGQAAVTPEIARAHMSIGVNAAD